jgi:hypothetical protein
MGPVLRHWIFACTILYADGQILMATTEDDLQTKEYHLNLIARK